ncbi:MAG: pyridoxamine 5'-phosphate oxidase family protein [Cypionkella sp.]
MTDLKQEFWDRMKSARAGMLGIKGAGRLVAMSPQIDDRLPGDIWFITAKGTDLARGVEAGAQAAQLVIADESAGLYADIDGSLAMSHDPKVLEDVWNFAADAWFENGKDDPDVRLLRFTPGSAEISITTTSGVKFLYEITKSTLTGAEPDVGAQGALVF